MEVFGCCSSYKECSQLRECIHKDDIEYKGCQYRKNLEKGKIFYLDAYKTDAVSNSNTINNTISDKKKEYSVYLKCLNRAFKVAVKDKSYWYSYRLKKETADEVKDLFEKKGIPYVTSLDNVKCIIDAPTKEDTKCANSRVIFTLGDREYIISNYNSYLIKESISKTIVAAFRKRGIDCDYELMGLKHDYVPPEDIKGTENTGRVLTIYIVDLSEMYKKRELEAGKKDLFPEKKNYTQVSIFELMTG